MKFTHRLMVLLPALILVSLAGFISFNHVKAGGTTGQSWGPYSFSVDSSDFNAQGYYKDTGIFNVWRMQTNPPNCGGSDSACLCGSVSNPDFNYTEAHGWPLSFAYYHITCGSLNVYLVFPLILDLLFFTLILVLIAYVFKKVIKHIKVHST